MAAKIEKKSNFIAAAVSYFLTYFVFIFFRMGMELVVFIPVMAAVFMAVRHSLKIRGKKLMLLSAVYSVLLAASFTAGAKIDTAEKAMGSFGAKDAGYFAVLAAFFFFLVSCVMDFAVKHTIGTAGKEWDKSAYTILWVVSSAVLLLCWFPAFLIYYPGNISGDSVACIIRAIGKAQLSNQQPVCYILLMRPFLLAGMRIKDLNFGIGCFAIFQSAVMAVSVGYALCRLKKAAAPFWAVLAAGVYFIVYPVFAMYSVTLWKDILFSAFLLLYSIDIYGIVESGGKITRSAFIRVIVLSLLICFFRNNGFFIVAAVTVTALIVYRKYFRRFAPAFFALLICVPIIQGPVYSACGVQKSPFAESVAIPLQQMARVVNKNGNITGGQREFLNRLLNEDEMKKAYRPLTADGIKFNKDFDNNFLETHKPEFFKTWAGMLLPNFKEYVKAYCLETVGFWHVGTNNWVLFYGTADIHDARVNHIVSHDLLSKAGGTNMQKDIYYYYKNWSERPLLSDSLNIGFLFWAAVLSALTLAVKKGNKYLLLYLPLLVLWATLMIATPTFCEYRYMFAFVLFLPFGIIMPFLASVPAGEKSP